MLSISISILGGCVWPIGILLVGTYRAKERNAFYFLLVFFSFLSNICLCSSLSIEERELRKLTWHCQISKIHHSRTIRA